MMKEILKASAEELEKVRQYCADDQAENVAQQMFIKGAEWAVKNLHKPPVSSNEASPIQKSKENGEVAVCDHNYSVHLWGTPSEYFKCKKCGKIKEQTDC